MSAGPIRAAVARAQASLDQARNDLDSAVLSMAVDGETVMASAGLLALLVRVVTARRHLEDVARPASAASRAPLH